jgi:DNA-binding NarL/FixJ family response regulator
MLDSLAKGSSNKEIAADHHISERTVGSHLRSIYAKLHVRGRTEAASKYLGRPSNT